MSKYLYAIIKSGKREYKVTPGKLIKYERLDAEPGESVELDQISCVVNGGQVVNGEPIIEGACVRARVVKHENEKGIIVFRLKRRTLFHRKSKHRLSYTKLQIEEIVVGDLVLNKADIDPRKIKKSLAAAKKASIVSPKPPRPPKPAPSPRPVKPEPVQTVATAKNNKPVTEPRTVPPQVNIRSNGIWLGMLAVLVLGAVGYLLTIGSSTSTSDKPVIVTKPLPADVRLRKTLSVDNPNSPTQPPD